MTAKSCGAHAVGGAAIEHLFNVIILPTFCRHT